MYVVLGLYAVTCKLTGECAHAEIGSMQKCKNILFILIPTSKILLTQPVYTDTWTSLSSGFCFNVLNSCKQNVLNAISNVTLEKYGQYLRAIRKMTSLLLKLNELPCYR